AIYTFKSGLSPKESERYREWLNEANQKVGQSTKGAVKAGRGAKGLFNQPISPVYPLLMSRHKAVVENFERSVQAEGGGIAIFVDRLQSDEAIYYLRRFVDGTTIPPNWRPKLLGFGRNAGALR